MTGEWPQNCMDEESWLELANEKEVSQLMERMQMENWKPIVEIRTGIVYETPTGIFFAQIVDGSIKRLTCLEEKKR